MPIQVVCPGCGWGEQAPDHLLGKKLRCKRCKNAFVAGGVGTPVPVTAPTAVATPIPLEPPPPDLAQAALGIPTPPRTASRARKNDDDFEDDVEEEETQPTGGFPMLLVSVVFIIGLLLGGLGAAAYLFFTKPDDAPRPAPTKPAEPKFTRDPALRDK